VRNYIGHEFSNLLATVPYDETMTDWVMISALTTGGGTLVLASATFASVRSANRAARVAEQSLLAGIRPLLMPSRLEDAPIKVGFADNHFVVVSGSSATAEVTEAALYLTMSIRNVGSGIAVLHGWRVEMNRELTGMTRPPIEEFRRLTRDLYVAAGDVSFWQGAYRDPAETEFAEVAALINARERLVLDVLYGDQTGGQRVISRFSILPRADGGWLATVARHWNVDRPDPRS
jgi:hypothetical protein